jgi:Family of unknown function (DUF6481)
LCGAEGAATKPWDMNSFRKPDFVERRDAAAHAKKAALEKFHRAPLIRRSRNGRRLE